MISRQVSKLKMSSPSGWRMKGYWNWDILRFFCHMTLSRFWGFPLRSTFETFDPMKFTLLQKNGCTVLETEKCILKAQAKIPPQKLNKNPEHVQIFFQEVNVWSFHHLWSYLKGFLSAAVFTHQWVAECRKTHYKHTTTSALHSHCCRPEKIPRFLSLPNFIAAILAINVT